MSAYITSPMPPVILLSPKSNVNEKMKPITPKTISATLTFLLLILKVLSIVRKTVYDYIWKEHLFLIPNQTVVKVLCIDQDEV